MHFSLNSLHSKERSASWEGPYIAKHEAVSGERHQSVTGFSVTVLTYIR